MQKYFVQIELPMTSVICITKEKTAKIIPNAIAIATDSEKHYFSSFITRDPTFNLMEAAWKKALERNNMTPQDVVDGVDTESEASSSSPPPSSQPHRRLTNSNTSRLTSTITSRQSLMSTNNNNSILASILHLPPSFLFLLFLIFLLCLLLLSSIYLLLKLDHIEERMQDSLSSENINPDFLSNWRNMVNSR